jgi:hypothetical protein
MRRHNPFKMAIDNDVGEVLPRGVIEDTPARHQLKRTARPVCAVDESIRKCGLKVPHHVGDDESARTPLASVRSRSAPAFSVSSRSKRGPGATATQASKPSHKVLQRCRSLSVADVPDLYTILF